MARLILSLDGSVMAEYNMNKERYTIGRLPDNDIRIDNPAVSGHHSLIINILNDSFLEDLNSTNGTYVNGKLIKKHALQHGDVVTVGHHQLRFVDTQSSDSEPDEFEKTMVITPGSAVAAIPRASRRRDPPPSPRRRPPRSRRLLRHLRLRKLLRQPRFQPPLRRSPGRCRLAAPAPPASMPASLCRRPSCRC